MVIDNSKLSMTLDADHHWTGEDLTFDNQLIKIRKYTSKNHRPAAASAV